MPVKPGDIAKMDEIMFPGGVPSKVVVEKRETRARQHRAADESGWGDDPKTIPVAGVGNVGDCFYISAYAKALNRKTGTIRLWEDTGVTGNAPLRGSAHRGATGGAGRRIYTRYYIEGAIEIAVETGVIDPDNAKRANWAEFTLRMTELRKRAIRLIKQGAPK